MAVTTNRLTGMYSGMDTDTLVKAMVSGQQAKIDRLMQQKTKAQWKVSAYNDFNTKLKTFRETFGSVTGKSSLIGTATYHDFSVNMEENNNIKVTATSAAKAGNYSVKVNSIATASQAKSQKLTAGTSGLSASALKNTSIGSLTQLANGPFTGTNSEFSFSINNETFTFSSDDSLQAVMDKVNASGAGVTMSYSQVDDKITISSKFLGEYKGLADPGPEPLSPGTFAGVKPIKEDYTSQSLFEEDMAAYDKALAHHKETIQDPYNQELTSWKAAKEAFDADQKKTLSIQDDSGFLAHLGIGAVANGQDANVEINGETLVLNENTVTLDGVQMTFLRPTEGKNVAFDLVRNTDKGMETIKTFVEEFNSLVKSLYEASTQKVNKEYSPLSDLMKEEMSEAEIEKWESLAKEGILYRDSNVERIYNGLRSLLNQSFGDMGRLSAIGITTGSYAAGSSFELTIDEEKLRAALESDPDGVHEMFSAKATDGNEGGFITRANKLIDNFTNSTKAREITTLNNNILNYDKSMKTLEDKLVQMSERYYMQYAKMETALSELQTQSDSLASLLGTNGG